jgi:hypothetical protein
LAEVERLTKADAIKISIAGDLGLMEGTWPIIGDSPSWDPQAWPMPQFLRKDDLTGKTWLVTYADGNPNYVINEEIVSDDTTGFERDALSGAGAIELVLTQLLST